VVSDILSALFLFYFFFTRKNEVPVGWKQFRLNRKTVRDILSVGSASIIGAITMNILTILLNHIATNTGGDIALATLGIIMRLFIFLTTPLSAINQGLQPIVGYNFGARRYSRVVRSLRIACGFSTALMIGATLLFYHAPESILRIFTQDRDLLLTATKALRSASICLPLVGYMTVAGSIFQALGRPISAILFSLSRQGVVQVPSALILFLFFGLEGIWLSFPATHFLSFILTLILLKRIIRPMVAAPPKATAGQTASLGLYNRHSSPGRLFLIILIVKNFFSSSR
jgi:Na+-driven multidrug efflux pump